MMRTWLTTALLCFFGLGLSAQPWSISGRVTDADTGEGVPFANVFIVGATQGTSTDIDGYYTLQLPHLDNDSLAVSALGYREQARKLGNDPTQTFLFALTSVGLNLDEVVVLAGENPANRLVEGIIAHKHRYRPEALPALRCESYAKVELDLKNVPESWRGRKALQPFDFVFENIDSTSDEVPYLPFYLNEVLSDVFYVGGKPTPQQLIRAQRASGVNNATVLEWIRQVHAPFSVYDNWITVLDKPFISPFANAGLAYYEYYILDSAVINNQWCYQLKFKPRRKQENTFYGDFWVADSSFAVQRVQMRMSPDVNINLVRRIVISEQFGPVADTWLPVQRTMLVDFTPAEGAPGMIARRSESLRNFQWNPTEVQQSLANQPRSPAAATFETDEAYWATVRHQPLSSGEAKIYALVDSIQNVPVYKTYVQLIEILFVGYLPTGKVEWGPYSSIFSNNAVEGLRFRLGLRTNQSFSERIRLGAHLAYGLRDQRWKYGGTLEWLLSREPRVVVGGSLRQDVSLNSESSEDFQEGDLFSGVFRRPVPQKLIFANEFKLYYERWWAKGFSNRVTLLHRTLDPYGGDNERLAFNFAYLPNPENPLALDTTINTTEFIFKTRFAFDEQYLDGDFERMLVGSKFPIIELQYTLGVPGLWGANYAYHKLTLNYRHYLNIAPIGWLSYRFEAGKVWGEVPFLLLKVHPGNESLLMSRGVFNTMNRYEFASDTYASLILEHHFDGFLLNKIPLLRKLNWRSILLAKAAVGDLSAANQAGNRPSLFNPALAEVFNGFRAPNQGPYLEVGAGIENIFKIVRIDALWRLRYLDNPQATRFRLMAGLYFFF